MKWGDWQFNPADMTIEYQPNGYYVDLDRCGTSEAILDWIFQIKAKSWVNPKIIYDLLSAIEDILDPQANYCSGAGGSTAGSHKAIELVKQYTARR